MYSPDSLLQDRYMLPASLFCRPWFPFGNANYDADALPNSPNCHLPFLTSSGWGTLTTLGCCTAAREFPAALTTRLSRAPVLTSQGLHPNVPFLSTPWSTRHLNQRNEEHPVASNTCVNTSRRVEVQTFQNAAKTHFCEDSGAVVREDNFMLSPKGSYFGKSSHRSGGTSTPAHALTQEWKLVYLSSSSENEGFPN